MKPAHEIISKIKDRLLSPEFGERHKTAPQHFTRKRLLSFTIILLFILNGIKKSIQIQLFDFVDMVGLSEDPTKQAFSSARKKISSRAFIELNDLLVYEYYNENKFKLWKGYLLFAVDGTKLQLPESIEIRNKYGAATNQTSKDMPMCLMSHVYDVLNGISIDAILAPYKSSERDCLFLHLKKLKELIKDRYKIEKILLLLDRGYPSYVVFFFFLYLGIDFTARCKVDFSILIKKILKKKMKDVIINDLWRKISGKHRGELKRLGLDKDSFESRSVRVIVIDLPTGEQEVLITSLIDQKLHTYEEFSKLYFARWGIEENLKFMKVRVEIENYSGVTTEAVEQDTYATILSSNIRALLSNEIQDTLEEETENWKDQKYEYKINKNVSIGALHGDILEVLFNPEKNVESFCNSVKKRMKRCLVPIRPGRKNPRVKKKGYRKFHRNRRRCY